MARVMINCPKTGNPVSVGMNLDPRTFETMHISDHTFGPCEECGGEHTIDRKDAFLEGDSAIPGSRQPAK